jgi:hypothetical protein
VPRTCTICFHKKRSAIDASLVDGEPIRAIASRFSVGRASLQRHQRDHLADYLSKARELQESEGANNLVARLRKIHAETLGILNRAKKSRDWGMALRAINRLEHQISLEGELLGTLQRDASAGGITIILSKEEQGWLGAPEPSAPQIIDIPVEREPRLQLSPGSQRLA